MRLSHLPGEMFMFILVYWYDKIATIILYYDDDKFGSGSIWDFFMRLGAEIGFDQSLLIMR